MNPTAFRLACVACACAMATAAQAQANRAVDVGVAYSSLRFTEEAGINFPVGWLVSVAVPTTDWLSVVGEVAGDYKTFVDETLKLHFFQGGVRVVIRRNPNVRPYGQFLLGGANERWAGDSETEFLVEPGGGVDVPISGRVAVRVGIGFPVVLAHGTNNAFRFHVGLVF